MRTVKRNPFLSGVCAVLGGMMMWAGAAAADVTSDKAAGIVIFPKLVADTDNGIDTEIQLSNTSGEQINVVCFYVNANSHCTNDPETVCRTNEDCDLPSLPNGTCAPGWVENDFRFTLTAWQPIFWRISQGMQFFPLDGFERVGIDGQFNEDSSIPPVAEDPFIGELKCIQVGPEGEPTDRNALKGEATIVQAAEEGIDARGYNAVGIQAREGANDGDNTLIIGEEYNGCPAVLIMNHFFDDAIEPINENYVRTDLTLVPCSQDFLLQAPFTMTVQFLVFNEFEQRFSTSIPLNCFAETPLSDIDTRPRSLSDFIASSTGDTRSIFNVNVQGTLSGQTRIRGTARGGGEGTEEVGYGLLGVAEEFHRSDATQLDSIVGSAAYNIHQSGVREEPDRIRIP
jgi:hypothetical protein